MKTLVDHPAFNVAIFALLLMWLVVPLLVLWFVRRQIAGSMRTSGWLFGNEPSPQHNR